MMRIEKVTILKLIRYNENTLMKKASNKSSWMSKTVVP